ncbi:hypothetical protein IWX90DRAFT_290656 [Phyllosticta citrichinensis]|uniref:Secreted protein n=1 Tax=Phyllosticta citrichinensis TaxID=1130410 RepID=A0ABR1XJZ3_9PEZI
MVVMVVVVVVALTTPTIGKNPIHTVILAARRSQALSHAASLCRNLTLLRCLTRRRHEHVGIITRAGAFLAGSRVDVPCPSVCLFVCCVKSMEGDGEKLLYHAWTDLSVCSSAAAAAVPPSLPDARLSS